jgi:hypothetical protein
MPPKRSVLGFGTQQARARARQSLGRLRDLRVNKGTLIRYLTAVTRFLWWCEACQLSLGITWDEIDSQLCCFLESLWEEGEARAVAGDTISGVQHLLVTRRRFPGAWQLFTTWGRHEMPVRAPPFPPLIILAMAGLAVSEGRLDLCALILAAFHCCLRTGEMLSLCASNVGLSSAFTGALALPWTKIGQQRGAQEMVTIDDPLVGFWLYKACNGLLADRPILRTTGHDFRAWFAKALVTLNLQNMRFKPYSLRRGGACMDFTLYQDIQHTLFRGRWSDIRTGRIYITDGAAALTALRIPPQAVPSLDYFKSIILNHAS